MLEVLLKTSFVGFLVELWFSSTVTVVSSVTLHAADPLSMSPQKALETIGANLQKQYENWQPRVSVSHTALVTHYCTLLHTGSSIRSAVQI